MSGNEGSSSTIHQISWLGIYMGIGLAIVLLLPFPVDMIVLFGALFLINFFRRRLVRRYTGKDRLRGLFQPSSSLTPGVPQSLLRYYCMSCGKEHKEIVCPICGSKTKRAGQL